MARVNNGANGAPSGKVGAVVFCKWKDITYVRSLPKVRKKRKLSDSEEKNRGKFGFTQTFLAPFTKFFRLGFQHYAENMTAFNAAMSYHLEHAVFMGAQGPAINYEKFAISRGLDDLIVSTSTEIVDHKLEIKWEPKITKELLNHELTDFRAMVLLLPENSMDQSNGLLLGNSIEHRSQLIDLPKISESSIFHVYLGFAATDGSNRSMNSVYVGKITAEKE
ncbi:DUF6266 family protein [Sphingobacterium sp.]|uniref:DUF6266 family protein n=1 Tax=Sphingobacterium sp. TaxID=341027 RepID=UPI0031CF8ABF